MKLPAFSRLWNSAQQEDFMLLKTKKRTKEKLHSTFVRPSTSLMMCCNSNLVADLDRPYFDGYADWAQAQSRRWALWLLLTQRGFPLGKIKSWQVRAGLAVLWVATVMNFLERRINPIKYNWFNNLSVERNLSVVFISWKRGEIFLVWDIQVWILFSASTSKKTIKTFCFNINIAYSPMEYH